jgi:hypothetical protein
MRFLVDTGASFSIIPHRSPTAASGPRLFGPSGLPIACWGERVLRLRFNGRDFTWPFLLAAVDFPILGVDFLKKHCLMVDPANCRLVGAQGDSLAAMSRAIPPTASVVTGVFPSAVQAVSSPAPSPPSASSPSPSPPSSSTPSPSSSSDPAAGLYRAILAEFPDMVNSSKKLPPVSHQVVHHIVTTGPPIAARFRRLDGEKLEAAKAEFKQLEAEGIIQRSTSPWASPLHMVQKKDGSWRPCGDFRRLNVVTELDVYPLPNMLDFVAKAAGCTVFSKVHLRKGYHQIPVNPADVPKTAITMPFGLFEYKRLLFGLRNAGASFQCHMDLALRDLDATFAFVDDVLVCSVDHESHHLRQLFAALQRHNLVIHEEKCVWGASSIDFLGHRVSAHSVQPLPSHVAAVRDFPRPATVHELQAFLGMVNFYRRFLPALAKILKPLTDALRGGLHSTDAVKWSAECAEAFVAAKQALLQATFLAHPVMGASLSLAVDTSATHVGGTLQQQLPGQTSFQPLGFFSKKLDPAQQKYSAFDRELFAVYAGIRHFRHMLEGRRFTVYTDHKPLTHAVARVSDPWTTRQCRHLAYIAEYTSDIQHVAGSANVVADTLSRPPGHVARTESPPSSFPAGGLSAGNGQRATSSPSRPGPQSPASSGVQVVVDRPVVAALVPVTPFPAIGWRAMAQNQQLCPAVQLARSSPSLVLQPVDVQGAQLLCDVSRGATRPVVPSCDRQAVFQAIHGVAHPGIRASRRLISACFVWHGLARDVGKWCHGAMVPGLPNVPTW